MNPQKQLLIWTGVAVVFFVLLALLSDILLPFVVGAAIAYVLDPLTDRVEALGLSRMLSTIIIVLLFSLIILTGLIFLVPLLVDQLTAMIGQLPNYFQSLRDLVTTHTERWFEEYQTGSELGVEAAIKDLAQKATGWAGQMLASVWSGGLALVNILALFVITPVVAFYLLRDWDRMIAHIDSWLPREHSETIRMLAKEVDEVLAGFVRGQITVLLLLGTFYVVALTLIGLNFGLLIGVGAGLISFIPYVGPIAGFLVGGGVAVVQFWPEWHLVAAVLAVFIVGQAVEGNVLSPLIVGDRVRLHPVWLIFALFVFGYLFGFVGMLLAVPAAAAIGVLVRFGLQVYLSSSLYRGGDPGGSGAV